MLKTASKMATEEKKLQIECSFEVTGLQESQTHRNQPQIADCLLVVAVIIISALPYLSGLGFYADDWAYQAISVLRSNQGFIAKYWAFLATDATLRIRPVLAAYFELSLKAFGHNPLPYHVISAVSLALTVVILYVVLIELRAGYRVALAISLVYGLLPQYSTDRLWPASQHAVLCMLFALLGIYALLRSFRREALHPNLWAALSTAAFVLSLLSYEVALGLIVASLGVAGWRCFRGAGRPAKLGLGAATRVATAAVVLFVVGIFKIRTQTRIVYHHDPLRIASGLGAMAAHASAQALRFNLWSYCVRLPWLLPRLWHHSALTAAAIFSAAVIAISVSGYLWRSRDSSAIPNRGACMRLIAAGFALFFLGIFLFVGTLDSNFSAPGISNRITIAAALGTAFIWVALAGLVCSVVTNPPARARTFSVAVGMICGLNCLVVSGIAHYWDDAALRQSAILKSVSATAHSLPHGSALLLDGFCRYSGPGIVFETDWDTTGAIRLTLNDDSLIGDVVSNNAQFEQADVDTSLYMSGEGGGHYPYGDRLFIYNVEHQYLRSLRSKEEANRYLQAINSKGYSRCSVGWDGSDTKVF